VIILTLILFLLTVGVVFAFSGSIERHVMSSGGGFSQSGRFSIDATIGQPVAGVKVFGPYEVHSGFWVGSIPRYKLFLPSIMK
jgi:hypothetical protein